MTINQTDESY